MTIVDPMVDAVVTPKRSQEILMALADYHGVASAMAASILLVRQTEKHTIDAFYKHFTQCLCPSNAILLCIIEDLHNKDHRGTIAPLR